MSRKGKLSMIFYVANIGLLYSVLEPQVLSAYPMYMPVPYYGPTDELLPLSTSSCTIIPVNPRIPSFISGGSRSTLTCAMLSKMGGSALGLKSTQYVVQGPLSCGSASHRSSGVTPWPCSDLNGSVRVKSGRLPGSNVSLCP